MCGRYNFSKPQKLKQRYQLEADFAMEPEYNVAPSMTMPVIIANEKGTNEAVKMKWGLIPHWAKEPRVKFSTINARAETISSSPVYKVPFQRFRCLVPADGFYEWKKLYGGKTKIPYYFFVKDEEIFSFAGLYDIWKDAEGNEFPTYTIITTTPNKLMEKVHNRMPVILKRDDEETWLSPSQDQQELQHLLVPFPASEMAAYTVSTKVNSPKNNSPEIIKPYGYTT
jgi:putative SOS response-associated peptidase YedK